MCAHMYLFLHWGWKRVSDPMELGLKWLMNYLMSVKGSELWFSDRAVGALNHPAISSAPNVILKRSWRSWWKKAYMDLQPLLGHFNCVFHILHKVVYIYWFVYLIVFITNQVMSRFRTHFAWYNVTVYNRNRSTGAQTVAAFSRRF